MSARAKHNPLPFQRGLSLIELMIAMALGLVLTLGVVQIFLSSSKTYRLSDELGKIQENSRYVFGHLQREIRMAGHFGCLVSPLRLTNHLNKNGGGYEDLSYGTAGTEFVPMPVVGWESQGTGLGDDFEIQTLVAGGGTWSNGSNDTIPAAIQGQMLPGTDFIMINSGEKAAVKLASNPNNGNALNAEAATGIPAGTIVFAVTGDCRDGDLFQKGNNENAASLSKGAGAGGHGPGNETPNEGFSAEYDEDSSIFLFKSTAYYIGEGVSGEPALFRERIDAGDGTGAVELAEGVENMQILYGLSDGNKRRADRYVSANIVEDWDNVVSVRVALLFRSDDRAADAAEQREFNLAGTVVTSGEDSRARVVGISTIGVRNMLE